MPNRTVRVFIASPGDLAAERRAFKERIDQLNVGFGDGAKVEFVPVGWEDTLASTGRRVQSVINQEIDTCDVFVLAMHRRWGQAAPDSAFSSYTEEEFYRALERFKKTGVPEVFVFFKSVDEASIADPGPELTKVLKFRVELERTRSVLYRTFADVRAFQRDIDSHLRAFVKGLLPKVTVELDRLPLPLDLVNRVEQAEAEAKKRADEAAAREKEQRDAAQTASEKAKAYEARAEALASQLATQAASMAREGRVEEARQIFANAALGNTNPEVLHLAFEFYWRAGPLDTAQDMLERRLAIGGWQAETAETATGLGNLGLIYQTRGDLDRAEEMHKRALALDGKLRRRASMALDYSHLGLIYQTRGDLDRAEEMHNKALALETRLKRPVGMSNGYTNLGLIQHARGDLDGAEQMHRKALSLAASPPSRPAPEGIVTIPVVVHVVYRTPEENISEAQIQSQIAVLNQDYRARNPDLSAVPYPFKPLIGDACVEFELASKDPDGKPGTGITRTKTSRSSFNAYERGKFLALEGVDAWDTERYLNIWVCSLTGGILSHSQFPHGEKKTDGVIIANHAFGTSGSATAPFNKGRSATSAIGLYLGLRHIWEKEDGGPKDPVADTPPQEGPSFGQPAFPHISLNNGPHGDMFVNFMDYADEDLLRMFTKGQVLRIHATLQGPRKKVGRRRDSLADAETHGEPPRRGRKRAHA